MNIHYTILFTIELLHEYYSTGRTNDMEIVPSADTALLFRKMQVLWRKSGNRFIALINATKKDPNIYTPSFNSPTKNFYRELFGKTVMRFHVVQKNGLFLNYTNLPVQARRTFYFSNRAANKKAGMLYLTAPVPNFSTGKDYLPGNLVMRASNNQVFEALTKHSSTSASQLNNKNIWQPKGLRFGAKPLNKFTIGKTYQQGEWVTGSGNEVFEAVRTTIAVAASELSNTALWKARGEGELQYPTTGDQVEYSTGSYQFALAAPAATATINFFGFNYNEVSPDYNVPAGKTVVQKFTGPQSQVTVDMSPLLHGRYIVDVNGETRTIYYDPVLRNGNLLGVIEIFNHLPGDNDYAFLTTGEEIKQTGYAIHLPARSVLWKYNRKDGRASAIADTGESGYAFTLQGNSFISSRPILLSQDPVDTLELSFTDSTSKLFPLPNPPVQRLGRTQQNDFTYFSAELFLNY